MIDFTSRRGCARAHKETFFTALCDIPAANQVPIMRPLKQLAYHNVIQRAITRLITATQLTAMGHNIMNTTLNRAFCAIQTFSTSANAMISRRQNKTYSKLERKRRSFYCV